MSAALRKRSNKAPRRASREPVSRAMHGELGRIRQELTTIAHVVRLFILAYSMPAQSIDEHRLYLTVLQRFVVDLLHVEVTRIREIRLKGAWLRDAEEGQP